MLGPPLLPAAGPPHPRRKRRPEPNQPPAEAFWRILWRRKSAYPLGSNRLVVGSAGTGRMIVASSYFTTGRTSL